MGIKTIKSKGYLDFLHHYFSFLATIIDGWPL